MFPFLRLKRRRTTRRLAVPLLIMLRGGQAMHEHIEVVYENQTTARSWAMSLATHSWFKLTPSALASANRAA